MRLTLRDAIATLLVAVVAVGYVGYLIQGEIPFVKDPRGMAAVGLILGTAAFLVARTRRSEAHDRVTSAETYMGVAALVIGVVALILAEIAAAETLLAIFMIAIVAVWAVQMLHHAGLLAGGRGLTATHR